MGWDVSRLSGRAGDLHGREVVWSRRSLTWCEVAAPAVVLGSTQPLEHLVGGGSGEPPIEVARRRSGGGAVLVEPGCLVWADVVVPAGDRLWDDDVGRATWWLGRTWAAALAALGLERGAVHRGGLVRSEWSPWVCFAGLGPGEVTVAGRKAVGISQRRTRHGALFQCAVPLAWDPARLLDALALSPEQRAAAAAELASGVQPLTGRSVGEVEAAVLAYL